MSKIIYKLIQLFIAESIVFLCVYINEHRFAKWGIPFFPRNEKFKQYLPILQKTTNTRLEYFEFENLFFTNLIF